MINEEELDAYLDSIKTDIMTRVKCSKDNKVLKCCIVDNDNNYERTSCLVVFDNEKERHPLKKEELPFPLRIKRPNSNTIWVVTGYCEAGVYISSLGDKRERYLTNFELMREWESPDGHKLYKEE